MAIPGFDAIDFVDYHREVLPAQLAEGRGALAARALQGLGALAFRLADGTAYTYRAITGGAGVAIEAGDTGADVVAELEHAAWEGLVHDYESVAGLLYSSRVRCVRGSGMQFVAWEPALRAMFVGRPVFDPAEPLRTGDGRRVDPARTFTPDAGDEEMAEFLAATGYLVMRGVFSAEEIGGFLSEADELRDEAEKGDKLSWWATEPSGTEICCRVTRAIEKPQLATLFGEPRLQRLADLAGSGAKPRSGEGSGVTCIYKHPGIAEGLADLPWHRDCGMGGHALMCPTLIASVFLTPANADTGHLQFLPGSAQASSPFRESSDPRAPEGIAVRADPGDVSLHFGDVMHAAPPPLAKGLARYRISATCNFGRPDFKPHTGEHSYNQVLHQREDGQIEHLAKVAGRA